MEKVIGRMLDVLVEDVLPMTRKGVAEGNKVFGAAILRKYDLGLVVAGVNGETENPLHHGEVSCLNNYWAMPAESRPPPADCLFLSTHEPCSLCLSAITWSGFDNFYYLFSYEDSRDSFNIPHDLRILEEVFGCEGGEYNRENAFWRCHDLVAMVEASGSEEAKAWKERLAYLRNQYATLSATYQDSKAGNEVPMD